MSLFEILVILFVAFLLIKPEDFPKVLEKLKEVNNFLMKTKKEIFSHIDLSSNSNEINSKVEENIEQINFYLEKISSLGESYEGEYSLEKIRDHYQKLVKKSILKLASEKNKEEQ